MLEPIPFTPEMLLLSVILFITLYLFISELIRIDIAALLIMLLLGLCSYLPGLKPLIDPALLFSGFSSHAVLSIIGIMMIGAGLDKTGIMARVADGILTLGQQTERRIVARLTTVVGLLSAFMQNVGTTALFLPVAHRIAHQTGIASSRLLIPLGFCAILGGTLTMVGCSSLIILNDLINNAAAIPSRNFTLFDVTPIGLALLSTGVIFFTLAGRYLLPDLHSHKPGLSNHFDYLSDTYGIEAVLFEADVSIKSPIAGQTIRQIEAHEHAPQILSFSSATQTRLTPNRDEIIWPGSRLLMLGHRQDVTQFATDHRLPIAQATEAGTRLKSDLSGIAEVVIPPGSQLIGDSIGSIRFRKHYNLNLLGIHRGNKTYQDQLRQWELQSGDTLIFYGYWSAVARLASNRDFVVASDYPKTITRPEKQPQALWFFALAMCLIIFTSIPLPLALISGALGMILTGVLDMDEAYQAVSWKTVFLLGSLIPLGIAVSQTGTAAWLAYQILSLLKDVPVWVMQSVLAVLATAFTLVMSNVGATVLLVPVALSLAQASGADPAVFALTVALATSNSFLIPTHQVNALIMGPGGYKVADFIRIGGVMTVLYLLVLIPMLNWVF